MNRMAFIVGVCIVSMLCVHQVRAQAVQQYLQDKSLAVSHIEVIIPDAPAPSWWARLWSNVGVRSKAVLRPKEGTVLRVVSSAYASSPYQTDDTPCITASGTTVRPGVVATNFLPLGTIISIADKKYIVEDRMNSRYSGYYLDIWFPSTSEALEFGRKRLDITILEYAKPGASIATPTPDPVIVEEPKKTVWQTFSSSVSRLSELLFTKTYTDPNRYDVDCSK